MNVRAIVRNHKEAEAESREAAQGEPARTVLNVVPAQARNQVRRSRAGGNPSTVVPAQAETR